MKGKSSFTPSDAARIRVLLAEIRRSGRQDQKRLRAHLRRISFYISDFNGTRFTPGEFDRLVQDGRITIGRV